MRILAPAGVSILPVFSPTLTWLTLRALSAGEHQAKTADIVQRRRTRYPGPSRLCRVPSRPDWGFVRVRLRRYICLCRILSNSCAMHVPLCDSTDDFSALGSIMNGQTSNITRDSMLGVGGFQKSDKEKNCSRRCSAYGQPMSSNSLPTGAPIERLERLRRSKSSVVSNSLVGGRIAVGEMRLEQAVQRVLRDSSLREDVVR